MPKIKTHYALRVLVQHHVALRNPPIEPCAKYTLMRTGKESYYVLFTATRFSILKALFRRAEEPDDDEREVLLKERW